MAQHSSIRPPGPECLILPTWSAWWQGDRLPWTLQIRAVAVQDAAKKIAVGLVPLSDSIYTITQQLSIPANN